MRWVPWVAGGAVLVVLIALSVGSGSPQGGQSQATTSSTGTSSSTTTIATTTTTTNSATTTTTAESSTTTSSTSATSSSTTTTTIAATTSMTETSVVLEDHFDGSTSALPLFGVQFMESIVDEFDQLRITSRVPGVLPVMYPSPVGDVEIRFDFNAQPVNPGAGFGAVALSEDPADFVLESYVAIYVMPDQGSLTVVPFSGGAFQTGQTVPIPPEAGFAAGVRSTLTLRLSAGTIQVLVNEVPVLDWADPPPAGTGYWGPALIGAGDGDRMYVDDVTVEQLSG